MFNLFRKKSILADLIPEGFVDIHSHILPGIDDGAKDVEESLSLISQMKEMGFSKIIATPHTYRGLYDNTNETIKGSFDLLKKNLKEEIEIDYGSEYMLDGSLLNKMEEKPLLTIKDNYVLIEMSFISAPNFLYEFIYKLQINNYQIVLAHPERYLFLNNEDYNKLKNLGIKFQLNLLSTIGFYGKDVCKISDKLLSHDFIDYVGSDIHNNIHINSFKKSLQINNIEKLKKAINNNKFFK